MRLIDKVKEIILSGQYEELKKENDINEMFEILMYLGSFDAIEYLYNFHKPTEPDLNQVLFDAIVYCCTTKGVTECVTKSMILIKGNYTIPLKVNDYNEEIRFLCRTPGILDFYRFALELKVDINWNGVLCNACRFLNDEIIWFTLVNFDFDKDIIDDSFNNFVGNELSGYGNDDPTYEAIIKYFIVYLNANINLVNENGWESVYLDCLKNFPRAAKYFYRDGFDSSVINNGEYWQNTIEWILTDEKTQDLYKQAFEDLKVKKIDLSGVKEIFQELGEEELFIEYFES